MVNKNNDYTSDTIKSYESVEYVRLRPTALLKSLDAGGINHMVWEYITNSMDEFVAQKVSGEILVAVLYESTTQRFQILVADHGRGIPAKSLHNVFLKLGTSGKIDGNSAYRSSTGQFGQGAKAGSLLSKRFRAISTNYLEDVSSSLYLNDGKVVNERTEKRSGDDTGVVILFEPDTDLFFKTAKDYGNANYLDLVEMCRQLNVFNESIDFVVLKSEYLFDDDIWECPIDDIWSVYIPHLFNTSTVAYDSKTVVDKGEYLFESWRVRHQPSYRDRFIKTERNAQDNLVFDLRLYFLKKSITGNPQYFISVNNAVLRDKLYNSVTTSTVEALREIIAEYQENDNFKQFVLEQYNFSTMLLAVGVFYHGAQLGGTTKDTFIDPIFARQYKEELKAMFLAKGGEYWAAVANLLVDDIKTKYSNYYDDQPLKKADALRVYMDLNFCNNFHECRSHDSSRMELYIVEGTSAGNIIESRDPDFQAIYTTRGKPKNPAECISRLHKDRAELLKDPIYRDLMHILNVKPETTDMSVCRFGKIIIATDADPDGYHISALHVHNLYLINPKLITGGFVWVANPPLYSLSLGSKCNLFLRDKHALIDAKISLIYKKALDIRVVTDVDGVITSEIDCANDDELYRQVCYLVSWFGETFERLSEQLSIPLLILERLIYASEYLYPTIQYDKLASFFHPDGDRVSLSIDPERAYLVVSVGTEDYPISLNNIGEIINNYFYLINKYRYKNLYFDIKGRTSDTKMTKWERKTPMKFYLHLKLLDTLTKTTRYKGLGQMPGDACYTTLMDPATRSMVHVTELGDVDVSYGILGGKTSQYRKELMSATGSLSHQFRRTNDLSNSWMEVQ